MYAGKQTYIWIFTSGVKDNRKKSFDRGGLLLKMHILL